MWSRGEWVGVGSRVGLKVRLGWGDEVTPGRGVSAVGGGGMLAQVRRLGWGLGEVGLTVCIDIHHRGCGIGEKVVQGGALCSVGAAFGGVVCVVRWLAFG